MVELPFSVDSTPDLRIAHYPVQDMCFAKFERHLTMTESRVALGQAVVLVVAADTPLDDRHTLPDARSVRALLMKGDQGIVFRAWHLARPRLLSRERTARRLRLSYGKGGRGRIAGGERR